MVSRGGHDVRQDSGRLNAERGRALSQRGQQRRPGCRGRKELVEGRMGREAESMHLRDKPLRAASVNPEPPHHRDSNQETAHPSPPPPPPP